MWNAQCFAHYPYFLAVIVAVFAAPSSAGIYQGLIKCHTISRGLTADCKLVVDITLCILLRFYFSRDAFNWVDHEVLLTKIPAAPDAESWFAEESTYLMGRSWLDSATVSLSVSFAPLVSIRTSWGFVLLHWSGAGFNQVNYSENLHYLPLYSCSIGDEFQDNCLALPQRHVRASDSTQRARGLAFTIIYIFTAVSRYVYAQIKI